MTELPTVIITGGGTGGHVYPALAMAEGLRPYAQVVYVGDRTRLEARVVPARGVPFVGLKTYPFPRRSRLGQGVFALRLGLSVLRAWAVVRRYRPQLVVGVGGYVSVPTVLAASRQRVRIVLHEQNVRPGRANLWLQHRAALVMLSYAGARPYFAPTTRTVVTGCPVNPRLFGVTRAEARRHLGVEETRRMVLIVGGSGGAAALNEAVVALLPRLLAEQPPWLVYHITGPRYFEGVRARVEELGDERLAPYYRGVAYSDEMEQPYAAADLIVCRAGSSTLNEITALGLPAVLVPSPHVTDNHQEINARELEVQGAAQVLLDADLSGDRLYTTLAQLLSDEARLAQMGAASRALGRRDALERIVQVLREELAAAMDHKR
ncbi:MAG TPA: undecaprenyldiphospho-muramoylpentapeptide beta-N-acetylglucosaminyltransferase [Armatimonadetes bacterium]|nr:undecaprenyldiphospho-muramoylpentapeptide beta-N-acetylglucosaminyltransferase [Armatimonadota bacterium]